MQAMRKCHNTMVEHLVKAIPKNLGTKLLDQVVPECDDLGGPDLVILNEPEKKAY